MRTDLHHVTLNTGHVRRSPRAEVADDVIAALMPMIDDIAAGQSVPIESCPGYVLTGAIDGRCAVFTVSYAEAPVATIGASLHSRCGAKLWRSLHESYAGDLATDPDKPPPTPWCAARLEIGIALHPDANEWLGDFEKSLGWTFIEWRSRS